MFTHILRASIVAAAVAGAFLMSDASRAEEAKKAPAKAATAKAERKAPPVRVPAEYAELDLTDTQKADIAKLRTERQAAIAKITSEFKDKEMALLTAEQQTKVKAAEEAKKAAATQKKAPAKDAPATKPAK